MGKMAVGLVQRLAGAFIFEDVAMSAFYRYVMGDRSMIVWLRFQLHPVAPYLPPGGRRNTFREAFHDGATEEVVDASHIPMSIGRLAVGRMGLRCILLTHCRRLI